MGGREGREEEGQWRRKQEGKERGKEDEEGEEWEKEVKRTEGRGRTWVGRNLGWSPLLTLSPEASAHSAQGKKTERAS